MFVKFMEIKSLGGDVLYSLEVDSLRGYDFSGKNLQLADLRGKDLEGCSFSGADLTRARLDGAVLRGCNFTGCYMLGSTFDGADLSEAKGLSEVADRRFVGGVPEETSHFYDASWKGCNFTGVDLEWIEPRLLRGGFTSFFHECKGISVSRRKMGSVLFGV